MPLSIPAAISVPLGYRVLPPHCIQKKTDLQLTLKTKAHSVDQRQIGLWEPTMYPGYRADWGDNLVIRAIKRGRTF